MWLNYEDITRTINIYNCGQTNGNQTHIKRKVYTILVGNLERLKCASTYYITEDWGQAYGNKNHMREMYNILVDAPEHLKCASTY